MAAFLLLRRPRGAGPADREAVERARGRLGARGEVVSLREDLVGLGDAPDLGPDGAPPAVLRRAFDGPALYVAPLADGGGLVASDLCAILATGLVPRRLDPAGLAGLLWRGGAMDARLPVAGIRAVPPGGEVVLGPGALAVAGPGPLVVGPATDETVAERLVLLARRHGPLPVLTRGGLSSLALLAAWREASGAEPEAVTLRWERGGDAGVAEAGRAAASVRARHRMVDVGAVDAAEVLPRHLAAVDLPSADGLAQSLADEALRRSSTPRAVSSVGGDALFGATAALRRVEARGRPWLDRSRAPSVRPDPLDVERQRELELRAFRRVPVNAAHAVLALLPAATREALLAAGARPPDPFTPSAGSALVAVSEVATRSVLPDTQLRAERPGILRPWLAPEVLSAALGLPPRSRLGRSVRDSWLGRRVRAARGWAAPRRADGPARALEAWARGALGPWLAGVLAPARVAATGAFRPDGVAAAVERWRRGAGEAGFDARRVLFLATTVAWLEREGLDGGAP